MGADSEGFVTTNATDVFWLDLTTSARGRRSAGGRTPQALVTISTCSGALAADATNVYCLTQDGIAKAPVTGGPCRGS